MLQPSTSSAVRPGLRIGILLVGMSLSVGVYSAINTWVDSHLSPRMLPTPIDDLVPFVTASVLAYGGIYALALTPLCLLQDRRVLMRSAAAYGVLLASAVPWWFLFPVTVPRTPVPVEDVLSWGVAFVRYFDPPTNCFPSMHVGETVLAALICWRLDRPTGAAVALLTLLVWWSTLALDQHWFVDGLFGAGLAVVVDAICFRWRPLPPEAWNRMSRWYLLWAVALYLAQFVTAAAPWWLGLATPAALGAG